MNNISIVARTAFIAKKIAELLSSLDIDDHAEQIVNLTPRSADSLLLSYYYVAGNDAKDKFNMVSLKRLITELCNNDSISMDDISSKMDIFNNRFGQYRTINISLEDIDNYCDGSQDYEQELEKYKAIIINEFSNISKKDIINTASAIVDIHKDTLARKKKQLIHKDDYGIVDSTDWEKEKLYFIEKILLPLNDYGIMLEDDMGLLDSIIETTVGNFQDKSPETYSPDLSPHEYENHCASLLEKQGWEAQITKKTGDQGIDIIARKNGITISMQCKHYSQPVGNKAVQEAYSGKGFYNADVAVVITNNEFTKSAKELAASLDVILIHHSALNEFDRYLNLRTRL